jgi:hypothetical protein
LLCSFAFSSTRIAPLFQALSIVPAYRFHEIIFQAKRVLALRDEREGSISSVICFLQADVEKNGTKEPKQISASGL